MWLRIVRARRSASTAAATVAPTRSRPWSVPAVDDEPARRPLGVGHREERRAAAGLGDLAAVADLAAALGVERACGPGPPPPRRGRSARRRRRRRGGSRRPCPRPRSSRSPGRPCRRSGGRATRRARSARRGGPARPCGRRGCARAARRGRPRSPRRSTRTPYSAASSIVRSIGKPYVSWSLKAKSPARTGASAGTSSGRRPTTRSASVSGMSASSSWAVPASSVRANWASSRATVARIRSRSSRTSG